MSERKEPTREHLEQLQRDAGIPHLPTPLTYELRLGVSGEGPRAYDWSDKPHRLLYDACREIERLTTALDASGVGGWRAIESAPKDGTLIIAFNDSESPDRSIASWCEFDGDDDGGSWMTDGNVPAFIEPTHWMPLPGTPGATPPPLIDPREREEMIDQPKAVAALIFAGRRVIRCDDDARSEGRWGIFDSVDNDGVPYTSHYLGEAIDALRETLKPVAVASPPSNEEGSGS